MTELVLDCSMAISWCFEDEASEKTDRVLNMVQQTGAWVPNLWHLEVVNVLIQASKRGRIGYSGIPSRLDLLSKLPIKTDMETHIKAFSDVPYLAEDTKLTSYDAAYLELAMKRKLFLATKDKALIEAARKLNVAVMD